MNNMFEECNSLKKINFFDFNPNKVSNISCIFCQCSSLKKIDLSNVTFDNVCDISFIFYGCSSLEEINILKFKSKKNYLYE